MRKISVLALSSLVLLSSCNFSALFENDDDYQKLTDVTNLFFVNPTKTDKETNEKWITIKKSNSRSIIEDEAPSTLPESGTVEHTAPYLFDNSLFLRDDNSRATDTTTTVRVRRFKLGDKRGFYDADYMNGNRTGTMKYEGEYCYIWTLDDEDEDSLMSAEEIEEFAEKFDHYYEQETAICGPKYDGNTVYNTANKKQIISPNEKISVLLFDIQNDKWNGNLLGYFHPAYYVADQSGKNQIELLCIDSFYAKDEDYASGLYSTVVHEFNHMLNFANKTLKYGLEMDTWYTEMLSMLTEDLFDDQLGTDFDNSIYSRLKIFVQGGYVFGFGNWADILQNDFRVSFNYSNAYAFGAFLARNYGGAELFHEIATNAYVNEESVVEAVNTLNKTNKTFEQLLKEFCLVLINPKAEDSSKPSLYREVSKTVDGYAFTLPKIDLEEIAETTITPIKTGSNTSKYLDSYGFHYYQFEEEDLKVKFNDFLLCFYY